MKRFHLFLLLSIFITFQSSFAWDAKTWKKPTEAEIKKMLNDEQYKVARKDGTERPYDNAYHDNKKDGIYVDIVSGEPLFSSLDKYDSGTGWPSFTQPLVKNNIVEKEDNTLFTTRTEVRSKHADSHLGHVFSDGPKPTGLRYCMNSASMRFIPKDKLKEEGYEEFLPLFADAPKKSVAVFAGGCFWCMEPPFDKLDGVSATVSGYTGGNAQDATYKKVSAGSTGHYEVVEVTYDPTKVTYEKLLRVFWANIDPYDASGQFCDKGQQYASAVFYTDADQKKTYEDLKTELIKNKSLKEVVATKLIALEKFYTAEDYHQDYYKKNPIRYKFYRNSCGRDDRLKKLWGSKKQL